MNGFPVTVQARGAALSTCQAGGHHLGPARAGEGAAGDERSDCQPRRPGPATPAVARELRPGTGWGGATWLPGDCGCVRVRAGLGAAPGHGSGRARCPGGAELAVLPGLEPHRGELPAASAGDAGDSVAGRAADRAAGGG